MPADFPMVPADRSALRTLALALVGCVSGLPLSSAQGLSLGGVSEDRPVEVSADSGIEWQQDAKVYIARGNTIPQRGTTEVHAHKFNAQFRPSKGAGGEP